MHIEMKGKATHSHLCVTQVNCLKTKPSGPVTWQRSQHNEEVLVCQYIEVLYISILSFSGTMDTVPRGPISNIFYS